MKPRSNKAPNKAAEASPTQTSTPKPKQSNPRKPAKSAKSEEVKSTPTPKPSSKRELSSPLTPEDYSTKKNKLCSNMAELESCMEADDIDSTETQDRDYFAPSQTHITIPETELQKMSEFIKPAIQSDVLAILLKDLKSIVKAAVAEVIDDKLSQLHQDNARLNDENEKLKERVVKLESAMDETEQYSRRNNLRISNIAESDDENTDQLVLKVAEILEVSLTPIDIDRSHRVGRKGIKPRRDIIVKFGTYRARERLFKNRAKLKDSEMNGVYINEDLTKCRSEILYQARQRAKSGVLRGAWSFDGRILVKDHEDKTHRITSTEQLDSVCARTTDGR